MARIDEINKEIEAKEKEWEDWNKELAKKPPKEDVEDINDFMKRLEEEIGKLEDERARLKGAEAVPEEEKVELTEEDKKYFERLLRRLGTRIKKIEGDLVVLTDEKKFFRTATGHEMRSLEDAVEKIKAMDLATFLHYFMKRKGEERGDFAHWIKDSLKDKPLADKIDREEGRLMRIDVWRKQWKAVGGRAEDFIKNPDVEKLARDVKDKVVVALEKRIKQIKDWRADKEADLRKEEEKDKKSIQKVVVEGENLLGRGRELDAIEDAVLRNIEENSRITRWILGSIPTITAETDVKERVAGWNELLKGVETMIGNSERNLEMARKARDESASLERDTKSARKSIPRLEHLARLFEAAAKMEEEGEEGAEKAA